MKKLFAVIFVLLIIFIGMYIYRFKINTKNNVNVQDVEKIQEYISKIYMWKEVTGEALPKFDDINNAPDLWVWEVVKKNIEDSELTYDQIENQAKQLFGDNFKKEFPKEGTDYIKYDAETNKYLSFGTELDAKEDTFLINKITKNRNRYEVEIIEYVEDHEEGNVEFDPTSDEYDKEYNVYIKNLNDETIGSRKSTEDKEKSIEIVKNNIDKFSKKTLIVEEKNNKIYVNSIS